MIIGFLNLEVEETAILLWSNILFYWWDQNQLVMEYAKQLSKFDKDSGQLSLKKPESNAVDLRGRASTK